MLRISKLLCVTVFSVLTFSSQAYNSLDGEVADSISKHKKVFTSKDEARKELLKDNGIPLYCGASIGADLVGPVMKVAANWHQLEALGRINLKQKYFPIVEVGLGKCDYTDDTSFITYQVSAPYCRLGCDINFAKNKISGNRIFGGVRYGFSSYEHDIHAPQFKDPNWGHVVTYDLNSLNGNKHWAELVFGLEAKLWKMIHLGWNFRYKFSLSEKHSEFGKPWYVPGYGENKNGTIGATFNLIFDLNLK